MAEERGGPAWDSQGEKMWQGLEDETRLQAPIAPSPEQLGECPTMQVLPGWDIGRMCSCKKNRGCFLSLKTSAQATQPAPPRVREAELRAREAEQEEPDRGQNMAGLQRTDHSQVKSN